MSDINFLPDEAKDASKEEKKIRRIEFTSGESAKKQKRSSEHGGVLSIFKKKDKEEEIEMTPAPPKPKKEEEPTVRQHKTKKKQEEKVIEITHPEKSEKKQGFFAKLFSKKQHPIALIKEEQQQELDAGALDDSLPPPPPPKLQKKEVAFESAEDKELEAIVTKKHNEKQFTGIPPVVPPPPVVKQSPTTALEMPQENDGKDEISIPEKAKTKKRGFFSRFIGGMPTDSSDKETPPVKKDKHLEIENKEKNQPTPFPVAQRSAFDVNLVPDELVVRKRTMNRLTLLGLITVLTIFGIGVLYGILSFYQQNVVSEAKELEKTLQHVEQQIDLLEPIQLDALVLAKRTQEVQALLDAHIHWTSFFDKLEKYTHSDIIYTVIAADRNGTVTLSGEAGDTASVFEQVKILENATDFTSSVVLSTGPTIPQDIVSVAVDESISTGVGVAVPSPSATSPTTRSVSSFSLRITLVSEILSTSSILSNE